MHYLIDGYNLIGSSPSISLEDSSKEEKLVDWLINNNHGKKHRFTVVFDGHGNPDFLCSRRVKCEVYIIFTSESESADYYIEMKLRSAKQLSSILLVSSDKEIIQVAKECIINYLTSKEFIAHFLSQKQYQKVEKPAEFTDYEYWADQFLEERTKA